MRVDHSSVANPSAIERTIARGRLISISSKSTGLRRDGSTRLSDVDAPEQVMPLGLGRAGENLLPAQKCKASRIEFLSDDQGEAKA